MKTLAEFKLIKHLEHIFLFITLGVIFICFILIGYWEFVPDKVFYFTSEPQVNGEVFHKGEPISYTFSYCKTRQVQGDLFRTLINGTVTTFTTIPTNLPLGCGTITKKDLIIPMSQDVDTYHLETVVVFKVNPLRDYSVSWKSKNFKIIE